MSKNTKIQIERIERANHFAGCGLQCVWFRLYVYITCHIGNQGNRWLIKIVKNCRLFNENDHRRNASRTVTTIAQTWFYIKCSVLSFVSANIIIFLYRLIFAIHARNVLCQKFHWTKKYSVKLGLMKAAVCHNWKILATHCTSNARKNIFIERITARKRRPIFETKRRINPSGQFIFQCVVEKPKEIYVRLCVCPVPYMRLTTFSQSQRATSGFARFCFIYIFSFRCRFARQYVALIFLRWAKMIHLICILFHRNKSAKRNQI